MSCDSDPVAAAGGGELQQQKEQAREKKCTELSVILFQHFSQLLCKSIC